eukprot:m.55066 g.55066  ORF g.55066 m.55066 type:complete len:144 (-) comp11111_c0_seq1:804-1235(-)
MPITCVEYAMMSNATYLKADSVFVMYPEMRGFTIVRDAQHEETEVSEAETDQEERMRLLQKTTGFAAMAFVNEKENHIVVAIRGTDAGDICNVIEDIQLALKLLRQYMLLLWNFSRISSALTQAIPSLSLDIHLGHFWHLCWR